MAVYIFAMYYTSSKVTASEFFVGHDERLVDGVDHPEAGQNMIDHWLAGDRQQRLGLVER